LAIADELPGCEVTATDTSAAALDVARANAETLRLSSRVRFLPGSIPDGEFDLIVANLPYVAESEWPSLQPEITDWEPREALLAGPDGLDAIRGFLSDLDGKGAGAVALEVGVGQADAVASMLGEAGFGAVERRRDLAGMERVVWGVKRREL